ncbi:AfsR/SARP family transcriptional regulator [Streptomyces alkaliphilus]|uniref:AfsR/SARP family transcriptional regulator n=1 Tax=Streptomyces alkaliphilus TaxID=1472722 RepID=UPI00117F0E69|nr:AfsR/SARP family transcriptional regulator [Streptomyces alkaliphilus]MQS06115.1 SARP family transcriptional regulator [Streptomyces alkaliphilus]
MEFRVLGPLSMCDDEGRHRTPTAPKQRQLLSLLALNANHVVSVAQIVEEIWEYRPPSRAVAAMHTYVMQLRRSLEGARRGPGHRPGRLQTRDPGYVLKLNAGELDLDRYEERVRTARATLVAGEYARAAEQLRAAEMMWTGPMLVDVPTGPLLRAAIEIVERDRLDVVSQRLGAELRLGRHHEILGELTALVHQYGTHEDLIAHLMLALYRSGRQADALMAYHRLRARLREELGTKPSARLQRLHTHMLCEHPRLEPPSGTRCLQSLNLLAERPLPAPRDPVRDGGLIRV